MANTLYVGSGQTYQTINDAVAAASATDATTIILAAGTYAEDITLDARYMEQKGNLKFIAAEGAEVTFTGLFTIGYYEKRVGSMKWDADVAFENIIFDQAADDKHSIDIQQVNDFTMTNCKVIGYGEYGIVGTNVDNGATITGTTFENAGIQSAGNFGTNLLLEDCTFDESRVNIQSGNSVTIKDCTFDCTVTDANVEDSFYCVRSNDNAIAIENTKFNIDSALTEVASEQGKWGVLWQRNAGGTKWSVSDIEVNFSDAAMSQSELLFNKNGTTNEANEAGRITVKGMSSTDNDIADLFAKSEGTLKALIDTDDGLRYNVYDDGVLQSSTGADTIYVSDKFTANSVPADLLLGFNAFADVNEAEAVAEAGAAKMVIAEGADVTYDKDMYYFLNTNPNEGGENNAFDNVVDAEKTYDMEINGTFRAYQILLNNANTTIGTTGKAYATGEAFRVMGGSLTVQGSRAEDAGAPGEIFTGSWGGGVNPGADAQISAGYFMVNQEAKVAYNDTVIFVAAGIFNVDNAEADFDNAYIYLGSVGTYADVQLNFTNGADVTFGNNTTVINDDEFGMHMTVDSASSVTVADSEVLTLDTVKNSGSIVLTGDATLEASDLANGCAITITGLTAGEARTVRLSMTAEGEEDGVVIDVAVAADATTATVYVSQFADGSYNAMVIDGNSVKQLGSIAVKTGSIAMDATSTIIADTYAGSKAITVTVDLENFSGVNKIIDLTSPAAGLTLNYVDAAGKALTVEELAVAGINVFTQADGDVLLANVDKTTLFVDGSFKGEFGEKIAEGKYFGLNAFNSFAEALKNIAAETGEISLAGDITEAGPAANTTVSLTENLTISGGNVTWTSASGWVYFAKDANAEGDVTLTFDGFTLDATEARKAFFIDVDTVIDGNSAVSLYNAKVSSNSTVTVEAGSQFNVYKEELLIDGGSKVVINGSEDFTAAGAELADRQMFLQYARHVKGDIEINDSYVASYQSFYILDNGSITADNSLIQLGTGADGVWHYNPVSNGYGELRLNSATAELNLTNGSVLEISGNVINSGTINVDGSSFIANGALVSDGVIKDAQNTGVVTNNGTINVSGESTLDITDFASGTLTVKGGTTLTDSTVAGAGYISFAANSTTTFEGENKITAVIDNSVAGFDFVVNEGASLLITRYTLGYDRDITVKGTIEDATALETLDGVILSLKANSTSGFSIGGWGTSVLDVKNAYIDLGNSSWKNATGTYTWNFKNSYVKAASFGNSNPAGASTAAWEITFDDSVLDANYIKNSAGVTTNFTNGSVATVSSICINGILGIDKTSKVSVTSYQNNKVGSQDEHGDINGTLNIAGELEIKGTGPIELYGGKININGGKLDLTQDNGSRLDVLVDADSELNIDGNFTAGTITNNGAVNVSGESTLDVKLFKGNDITASGVLKDSNLTMETFDWETGNVMVDGELTVENGTFAKVQFRADEGEKITLNGNIIAAAATQFKAVNGEIVVNGSFTSEVGEASSIELEGDDSILTIDKDAYLKITGGFYLNGGTTVINGELTADADKKALVRTDADVDTAYATLGGTYAADVTLNNAYVWNAMISINNADSEIIVDNSRLDGWMSFDITAGTLIAQNGSFVNHQAAEGWTWSTIGADAAIILTGGSIFDAAKTNLTFAGSISVDATSSFIANTLTGDGTITIDATGFTEGINKVIDLNETASREGKVTINGLEEGIVVHYLSDGDVILANADMSVLYVGSQYDVEFGTEVAEGKFAGINAFASFEDALALAAGNTTVSRIEIESDLTVDGVKNTSDYFTIAQKLTIGTAAGSNFVVDINPAGADSIAVLVNGDGASLTIEEGVTIDWLDIVADGYWTRNEAMVINGTVYAKSLKVWTSSNGVTVGTTGKVVLGNSDGQFDFNYGSGFMTVNGTLADTTDARLTDGPQFKAGYSTVQGYSDGSELNLNNTYFEGGAWFTVSGKNFTANLDNSVLKVSGGDAPGSLSLGGSGNVFNVENGSRLIVANASVSADNAINVDGASLEIGTLTNNGTITIDALSTLTADSITNNGSITIDALSTLTADSIANNGTITIDAAGFTGTRAKVIDLNQAAALSGVKLKGTGYYLEYAADGDVSIVKSPDTVYVSSDYNSSTEGWGYTHFANYDSAVAYIKDNAKKATMIIEKTTTVSGNCFADKSESLGVDLTNAVIVKDGAVVGNAQSKWDMTYSVTLEGGAILQSARPGNANTSIGNTHIKNVLTIGDGSEKRAEVRFIQGLNGITYKTMSIALLSGLNRKLVANNALIEVGDLGLNASASFTDTTLTIAGILAIKGTSLYKTTMTDTTVTINGHNLMNENTYYSTVGTILSTLTMDNTSITVDDGSDSTAAEKVWLGYTGNVAQTLTMNNGSVITIEKGAEVEVANKVIMTDSKIVAGDINAGTTKYGGANSFNFNGLEKGKVYWAVLYDADGNELETIERTSLNYSTFSPKFSVQPAGDYKAVCYKDEAKTEIHQEKTYSFTAVGTLTLTNSDIVAETITLAGGNLTMDYKSSVTFTGIEGGYITVSDAASYVDNADVADGTYKLLDYTGTAAMTADDYKVILNDAWHDNYLVFNNDLYLTDQDTSLLRVSAEWKDAEQGSINPDGSIIGFNAFAKVESIADKIKTDGSDTTVKFESNIEVGQDVEFICGDGDLLFTADSAVTVSQKGVSDFGIMNTDTTVTVGENVTFQIYDNASGWYQYYGPSLELYGTITGGQNWGCTYLFNGEHTVHSTGTLSTGRIQLASNKFTVKGDAESDRTAAHIDTNYLLVEDGVFTANNAIVDAGIIHDSNNGGMRWGASEFYFNNSKLTGNMTIKYADSIVEFNDSDITIGTLTNAGSVTVDGASTLNITKVEGNAINVIGGTLSGSTIGSGFVAFTGDAALEGENTLGGVNKVLNGSTLTIDEDADVTAHYLMAGEDNYFAFGNDEENKGGTIDINGKLTITQNLNANANGIVNINEGAEVKAAIVAVENGEISDAENAGVLNVDGKLQSTFLNVFSGGTANINEGGYVQLGEHETDQQLLQLGADSTVYVAGELNIQGSGTVNGALNVAGGELTVSKTLANNGTVTVTGESTVNVGTLSGTYIRIENGTLVGESNIGGNIRTYEDFALAGTLTVKQTNMYGTSVVKDGAVFNGSTTIVSAGGEFTLENGGTINSRFFNVCGNADIQGNINLEHSDPRQKLLQVIEDGIANINAGGVVTSIGHNAIVNEGGTLNINGGTLNITCKDAYINDPERGGILYNNGIVTLTSGGELNAVKNIANEGSISVSGGTLNAAAILNNGTVTVTGDSTLNIGGAISNAGTITVDAGSKIFAQDITGSGSIVIKDTGFTGGFVTIIDLNGSASLKDKVVYDGEYQLIFGTDGDVTLHNISTETIYVNDDWTGKQFSEEVEEGKFYGINAWADIDTAVAVAAGSAIVAEIVTAEGSNANLHVDVTTANPNGLIVNMGNNGISFDKNGAYTLNGSTDFDTAAAVGAEIGWTANDITIGENVTVNADVLVNTDNALRNIEGVLNVNGVMVRSADKADLIVSGELNVADNFVVTKGGDGGKTTVEDGGKLTVDSIWVKAESYSFNIDGNAEVENFSSLGKVNVGGDLELKKGISDIASLTASGKVDISEGADVTVGDVSVDKGGVIELDNAVLDVTTGMVLGDINVTDSTFTAEQLALNGCYIVSGFQIQDSDREVTLVFFEKDSLKNGRSFTATVKAGESFARFINNTIRDGEYDVTAVDGNESFIARYNADDGDFNVYGNSSVSVKELTGKIIINENAVLSKSEVKSGTVAVIGNAEMAGTNTLPNMYIAGTNADGSAATVVVDENSTLNASIVSVGGTQGDSDFDKQEYFGGYYNNVAGAMDIAGTFNTEALALYKDGKMTVSGTVKAPEFYLRDASAIVEVKDSGTVTSVFTNVAGTMNLAGTLNIKGANGEHTWDDILGIGGKLSVNGGTINSNRGITVYEGGELDIANGSLIFSDLNGNDSKYNGKLTANGSVNVTGESVVKVDTLAGTINVDDADLSGYVSGGTLNVTGESTIGAGFMANNFAFGTLTETVDANIDLTGLATAAFAVQNGTVDITGKMDASGFGLAQFRVSGNYNTANGLIQEGDLNAGSSIVNVGSATDTDVYVKAHQVYISETGAVNKHTLNVYGELEATNSIFNKYNGELNVYGTAAANYLQVAGNVTVTGEGAQLNLAGVGSNGAAKVGLDDGSSKFTISNGATLDADGVVWVGYNSDRNGEMIVDNATVDASAGITVAADSTFTIKGASTVKAAVTGNISLAGNVTLSDETAISIAGDVTADGDVEMKYNAITGATNFTVKGTLSLSDVELPTAGGSIILVEGNGSFGGLSINGDKVVDNALFFVNGNDVEFYNVTYGADKVTLDSVVYAGMSGAITGVSQQEGTYSFTVTPEIAGSIGNCTYSTSVYDANGKEIATAAGLTVTITDEKLLNTKLNFKVTVTDELGSDFAFTTDAFTADVKDYTGPLFTAAPAAVVENGKLQLSWEAFDAFGLDKYIITINGKKTTIDAYEKMTFGQNAIAGTNTYSIVAVDKNGNTSTVEGSSYVLSPAGNISGNAVTQIVGYDAARGAVGYIANEGVEAPLWKGIWEWGADSPMKAVALGSFEGTDAEHAGLLFYDEDTFAFGAWTDITDPNYGYVELGNAGSAVDVKAIGNFDGNDSDDILVEKEDGSIGIMTDVKKYTAITSGNAVELAGAGSFGAANGLDSIVVEKNGEFQLWNTDDVASGKWNATKIMNADNQQLLDITGNWEVSAIGDFKGDGIDDIIMTAENGYSFLLNDGKTDSVEWSGAISPDFEVAGVGDYNGDGTEDLLLREMTSGWGGLGYWNGGNAGAWVDLNARIETSDEDGHSGKFSVITVVK